MTARHEKTVIQPAGQPAVDTTQATVGAPSTSPTGGGSVPTGPITPPKIPDVELEAELGRGGMGVVYKGRQPYLDRRVAVKLLLLEKGRGSEEFVKRFQREAKILAGLSHPHIVGCYSAGVTPDQHPYLVMEFIDGPNLRDWVKEHGALPPAQAVALAREVARALEHANASGIIHRDVKPENVLLAKREGAKPGEFPWSAKLVDLGLARPTAKDATNAEGMHLTMQGVLMGTPATMAPEQFDDPDHVDFRADIYGLGCVLYHALTGGPAFASRTLGEILSAKVSGAVPNPRAQAQNLPAGVCDLVTWMLARDRKERPQSYQALIARCDELAADPSRARSTSSSRAPMIVGAIAAVIAAGVAVAALTHGAPKQEAPTTAPQPAPTATASQPTAAPAAAPAFGDAQPLIRLDGGVLAGWHGDGQWALSEDLENALSGSRGMFLHPLEPKPLKLEAELHPGSSKMLGVGVVVGDDVVVLMLKNLGSAYLPSIEAGDLGGKQWLSQSTGGPRPAADQVPVSVTVVGKSLAATIGGVELKPVALGGVPTAVALFVDPGETTPAQVGHLTVRYAP